MQLEVDEDKSTKGSIFTPRKWQLVCPLTPFPKRSISMFLKKKTTSPLQGCSWQDHCRWVSSSHCRKKGSSVTLDNVPVPPVIRAAGGTSSHSGPRLHFSVQSPHGPPHKAKGRATLKACQQSSGNYKSNFPGIVKLRPRNVS